MEPRRAPQQLCDRVVLTATEYDRLRARPTGIGERLLHTAVRSTVSGLAAGAAIGIIGPFAGRALERVLHAKAGHAAAAAASTGANAEVVRHVANHAATAPDIHSAIAHHAPVLADAHHHVITAASHGDTGFDGLSEAARNAAEFAIRGHAGPARLGLQIDIGEELANGAHKFADEAARAGEALRQGLQDGISIGPGPLRPPEPLTFPPTRPQGAAEAGIEAAQGGALVVAGEVAGQAVGGAIGLWIGGPPGAIGGKVLGGVLGAGAGWAVWNAFN